MSTIRCAVHDLSPVKTAIFNSTRWLAIPSMVALRWAAVFCLISKPTNTKESATADAESTPGIETRGLSEEGLQLFEPCLTSLRFCCAANGVTAPGE